MNHTETTNGVKSFGLVDSLGQEWLKLPLAAVREAKGATQTLAGLLRLTKNETFCAMSEIAKAARLPVFTAKRHVATLHELGWIENTGRRRTGGGALRRTVTIKVTAKTTRAITNYAPLPWWACCRIWRVRGTLYNRRIPWASRVLLSVLMQKLMKLKSAIEKCDGCDGDAEYLAGTIENWGAEQNFRWSLQNLVDLTALSRESVTIAKHTLASLGIVELIGGKREDGAHSTDAIYPNWKFEIITTDAPNGGVFIDFGG